MNASRSARDITCATLTGGIANDFPAWMLPEI
jgi:hypothetical protein